MSLILASFVTPIVWCSRHGVVTLVTASVASCEQCQTAAADYQQVARLKRALRERRIIAEAIAHDKFHH